MQGKFTHRKAVLLLHATPPPIRTFPHNTSCPSNPVGTETEAREEVDRSLILYRRCDDRSFRRWRILNHAQTEKKYSSCVSKCGVVSGMILSANGLLNVVSAYVNLITVASFLQMSTETTQRFAKYPAVRAVLLFAFAFSAIPSKLPCLVATLLFFVVEVKNFVTNVVSTVETHDDK